MLLLNTFGGVSVTRSTGAQPGNAASQRRVLALLAAVAGSGSKGITRDRLMAILWPEADSDRARHALSQTLYHTRSALQEPDLFLAGNEIRLNPAVIAADTWEFERLLAAGDDERAVEIYGGPFLDGFYLAGSAEFEEWSASEQRRYATLASSALERLSARAESEGNWAVAVAWRQRLAALDITSSRATLSLMKALVNAGDSAAALRHADVHRRAVRALLDAEPDASILSYEASLRTPRVVTPAPVAPPVGKLPPPHPVVAPTPEIPVRTTSAPRPGSPRVLRTRRAAALLAVPLVAAVIWLATSRPDIKVDDSGRIAIAPFRIAGADPGLAYLREGMIDLLAARLQDPSLVQSLDAGRTMAGWHKLGLSGSDDVDVPGALRLAKGLGAPAVIVGSIVGSSHRLHITASLIESPSGYRAGEVSAEGPVDSLAHVIDQLAAKLLTEKYAETDRLVMRRATALPALRPYLAGQIAYRRGDYQTAGRQYEAALRADSQFALAAFQLALAFDRINGGEQNPRALSVAWSRRDELSPRDRAQLIAFAGPEYPRPSSKADAVSAMTSAVNLRPLRPEMWYEFGERLLRLGPIAFDDGTQRAVSAFARALELDPADRVGARPMLVIAAARLNDTATMLRYATPAAIDDSMRTLAPFIRWTMARVRGDRAALDRMRAQLSGFDAENLRLISMSSLYDRALHADGERAAKLLARRTVGSRGLDALLAEHAFALASGDTSRALAATERIKERFPGVRAHLRLRVLDALYGGGNATHAERAVTLLAQGTARGRPETEMDRAVYYADLCVVEQWRLHHGVRSSTASTIAILRASDFPRVAIAISANPHTCATLLETWLAVESARPDAREKVFALDSLFLVGPGAGDASRYAHILVARLHLKFGDESAALAAIRRRSYLAGWPRYAHTVLAVENALTKSRRPLRSQPAGQ